MRWAELKDVLKRGFSRGTCPYQLAFFLDFSLRRFVLSPERLADRLELNEKSRVLELGPGLGYFSRAVARRVPNGYLLLVDLQPAMLRKARGKLAEAGIRNTGFVQADGTTLPLPSGARDCAFLVAVPGEVPDPTCCLQELYRVLRPKGLLSLTEQPALRSRASLRMTESTGFSAA
jgi:ubiquinone/menaquinone biosynthesis C-methylase UbiE